MLDVIKSKNNILLLNLIIIFYIVLNSAFHKLNIFYALLLYIVALIFVYIPGRFISEIFNLNSNTALENIVLSLTVGVFKFIIEYFLCCLSNNLIFKYIIIVVSNLFVFLAYKKLYKKNHSNEFSLGYDILAILFIAIGISFLCVSINNSSPFEINSNEYHNDLLFWISNCVSMTKTWPIQNPRFYGEILRYHYFSSIIVAQLSMLSGINVTDICLYYSGIFSQSIVVFGAFYLFSSILKNKKFILLGVVASLFTDGISVTYVDHVYFNPFGFDYGFGFGMIALGYLLNMVKGKICVENIIVSTIFIFLVTGLKGPVGLVLIFGYFIIGLNLLIKKEINTAFACGIPWILAFIFTYVYFLGGFSSSHAGGEVTFIRIEELLDINPWVIHYYKYFKSLTGIKLISRILAILKYVLFVDLTSSLCGIILVFYCIFSFIEKKSDYKVITLTFMWLCSNLLYLICSHSGTSQMYFPMAAIPYSILGFLYILENKIESKTKLYKMMLLSFIVTSIIGFKIFLVGPSVDCFGDSSWYGNVLTRSISSIEKYNKKEFGLTMDKEEYEFCLWIRENIPEDAVIAIYKDDNTDYHKRIISAFGERLLWNDQTPDYFNVTEDRDSEIFNIFHGEKNVLTKDDVLFDYIVIYNEKISNTDVPEYLHLIYAYNDYKIYQIDWDLYFD